MPEDILEIKSKEELEKFIKDLEKFVNEVIAQEDYVDIAFNLINAIEKFLKNNPTFPKDEEDLYKRLEKIHIKLKFIAISFLSEKDIIDLLQYHYVEVYELDLNLYNLWDKIVNKLLTILFLTDRDNFKINLQIALLNNNQNLTETKPVLGGKEQEPSVKNWILDYKNQVGDEPVDEIEISRYLNSADNPSKLETIEKKRLEYLVKFFEKLKISSFDPKGFEESFLIKRGNRYYLYSNGILEDISKNKKVMDILDFLEKQKVIEKNIFKSREIEQEEKFKLPPLKKTYIYKGEKIVLTKKNLMEDIRRIIKENLGEVEKIKDVFYNAIVKGRIKDIVACIYILNELSSLADIFSDKRFREYYKSLLSKSHPKLASRISENWDNPKLVKDFINYILFTIYQLPKDSVDWIIKDFEKYEKKE